MKIKTIDKEYIGEFKSLNSKFIGYLMPFEDKTQLNVIIDRLTKEHPKVNHICYAYRIGFENEETRANDDGEPSGSAGKPILNQLYSFEAQNCILLVVRYFGGTKLGVPGLIEAYKEAAISCLSQANLIEKEASEKLIITVNQDIYFKIIKYLKFNDINIVNSIYDEAKYTLEMIIPKSKKLVLLKILD